MKPAIKLIGREPEIEKIDRIMQSGQAEFLAIYGSRRVGKTFLIRQYLKDSLVFDFTGTKEGIKEQQLLNFFAEYTQRAGSKTQKQPPLSWQDAFNFFSNLFKKPFQT